MSMKWSLTKSICSALNFTLSTVELEQRLSLPSPLTTAPGYKNCAFLHFLYFSTDHCPRFWEFCILRILKFCVFCPGLLDGFLTNQITITNLFQAVRNLPRRRRLRSVLEVPRWKTEQVQLPTRTRLWLGTSNTFFFKTECLMSQLSHCLISHRLLLCCLWLIWLMTCTHCSVLIVLPSLLPTTCMWLASIVGLF